MVVFFPQWDCRDRNKTRIRNTVAICNVVSYLVTYILYIHAYTNNADLFSSELNVQLTRSHNGPRDLIPCLCLNLRQLFPPSSKTLFYRKTPLRTLIYCYGHCICAEGHCCVHM